MNDKGQRNNPAGNQRKPRMNSVCQIPTQARGQKEHDQWGQPQRNSKTAAEQIAQKRRAANDNRDGDGEKNVSHHKHREKHWATRIIANCHQDKAGQNRHYGKECEAGSGSRNVQKNQWEKWTGLFLCFTVHYPAFWIYQKIWCWLLPLGMTLNPIFLQVQPL